MADASSIYSVPLMLEEGIRSPRLPVIYLFQVPELNLENSLLFEIAFDFVGPIVETSFT